MGQVGMGSARASESVIPMRTRQRMFPPRDGAPAHVSVSEGVGPGVPRKSRWWGADFLGWGGGVVLPRQAKRSERLAAGAHDDHGRDLDGDAARERVRAQRRPRVLAG